MDYSNNIQVHLEIYGNITEVSKISVTKYQISSISYSESFKCKLRIWEKIPDNGNTKDVEIPVLLKYLGSFVNLISV